MTRTTDRTKDLYESISRSGYYPEIVAGALEDALATEPVESFVVHHEPTFDREEIRRVRGFSLTDTRSSTRFLLVARVHAGRS